MPSASVSTAMTANPGLRTSVRAPKRTSCQRVSILWTKVDAKPSVGIAPAQLEELKGNKPVEAGRSGRNILAVVPFPTVKPDRRLRCAHAGGRSYMAAILATAVAGLSAQTTNPRTGTWKINLAKSR